MNTTADFDRASYWIPVGKGKGRSRALFIAQRDFKLEKASTAMQLLYQSHPSLPLNWFNTSLVHECL
jgi:hypothetical protein